MAGARSALRALQRRFISSSLAARISNAEIAQMRNDLFTKEKERQLSMYPRIEKIEVKHVGKTDPGCVFVLNKGFSTPYNCAMHLTEWYCSRSVLALVDGEEWDMYRPFTKSCEIQFLTFKDDNPEAVNQAYWRSCAMMLGYALETAFKDEYAVQLLRAPEVQVISGAFCYDVVLDSRLDDWKPTQENLKSITKDVHKLIHKDVPFEFLEMDAKVAQEIFQHNNSKLAMIEERASKNMKGTVQVHRCGEFVDLTEGPHIPRTNFCYQYDVTAAHNLSTDQPALVRRFQGISLPGHLRAHHTIWRRLQQRSQKLITEEAHPETKETSTE